MLASRVAPNLDAIDVLLPQTQCQRCGYADCASYARAMQEGSADIDRCPPGGEATRAALAALFGRETVPPLARDVDPYAPEHVARIDETACIGCAACLPVCPTDAIIGATKRMHTVIAAECTGCELCIIACPVDCIELTPRVTPANAVHATLEERGEQMRWLRARYEAHRARAGREGDVRTEPAPVAEPASDRRAFMADILARARARADAS
ncbi:MAG: RnfABCDGE type electron transport complex subunit B [Burkholderiales bacterium]|nr:RnfABCDGE type electron transport complex subunit B [Burkholderiales bacterium]